MSISRAMKKWGLGTGELADLSGVEAKNLSAYKNGSRTMGRLAATKLSAELEESPTELMFGNRAAMLDRATKRGDRRGALQACKGMVEVGEEAGLDDESLDQIVEIGTKFAAETAPGLLMDDETLSSDGRDGFGRKVKKSFPRTATPEESAAFRAEFEDDEYDGIDDEGRDSRGIRVRPMKESY